MAAAEHRGQVIRGDVGGDPGRLLGQRVGRWMPADGDDLPDPWVGVELGEQSRPDVSRGAGDRNLHHRPLPHRGRSTRKTPPVEWRIRSGDQQATIVQTGGGLRSYDVGGRPLVDGYPPESPAPGGAGQVLAPWPNRIRDGRYVFAGQTHQLALTEPEHHNAIHGLVRREPWQLVAAADDRVTVEYTIAAQPGYPFTVRLATTWSISAAGLQAEHTATGVGPEPAPFGLGIHPYLLISGVPADDLTLTVPARQVLLADDRGLPTRLLAVDGTEWDFRSGRRIG